MSTSNYFPPTLGKSDYHCPHCGVYANQHYAHLYAVASGNGSPRLQSQSTFSEHLHQSWLVTKCQRCKDIALWIGDTMIYPKKTIAPPPNSDLAEEIKADYLEAASVLSDSPRAAAALLRLSLQKLCKQLGERGENINEDIKSLVSKGLNPLVQKSLDALRITGNNAVHPGEIDLNEESDRVIRLFDLINFIASKMLTEPREIEAFYDKLPSGAIDAVNRRDNTA